MDSQIEEVRFSTSTPLGALVLLVASDSCPFVGLSPLARATQEQLQSAITMASVIRIDSNVCLRSNSDFMTHMRHVHVPFFEGTCPKK